MADIETTTEKLDYPLNVTVKSHSTEMSISNASMSTNMVYAANIDRYENAKKQQTKYYLFSSSLLSNMVRTVQGY